MADEDFKPDDTSYAADGGENTRKQGRPATPEPGKNNKRKSAAGRKLMRWSPAVDQLVLLSVEYVVSRMIPDFSWNDVAACVNESLTGEGIKQHLAKVTKARINSGQPVPNKIYSAGYQGMSSENSTSKSRGKKAGNEVGNANGPRNSLLWYDDAPPIKPFNRNTNIGSRKNKVNDTSVIIAAKSAGKASARSRKKKDHGDSDVDDEQLFQSNVKTEKMKKSANAKTTKRVRKDAKTKEPADKPAGPPVEAFGLRQRAPVSYVEPKEEDIDSDEDVLDARQPVDDEDDTYQDDEYEANQDELGPLAPEAPRKKRRTVVAHTETAAPVFGGNSDQYVSGVPRHSPHPQGHSSFQDISERDHRAYKHDSLSTYGIPNMFGYVAGDPYSSSASGMPASFNLGNHASQNGFRPLFANDFPQFHGEANGPAPSSKWPVVETANMQSSLLHGLPSLHDTQGHFKVPHINNFDVEIDGDHSMSSDFVGTMDLTYGGQKFSAGGFDDVDNGDPDGKYMDQRKNSGMSNASSGYHHSSSHDASFSNVSDSTQDAHFGASMPGTQSAMVDSPERYQQYQGCPNNDPRSMFDHAVGNYEQFAGPDVLAYGQGMGFNPGPGFMLDGGFDGANNGFPLGGQADFDHDQYFQLGS